MDYSLGYHKPSLDLLLATSIQYIMTFFDSLQITLTGPATASVLFLDDLGTKLAIEKERLRSNRHGLVFSLVVLRLLVSGKVDQKSKISRMEKILSDRLRITDDRGLGHDGSLVLLLPQTNYHGAVSVVESITNLAAREEIYFHAQIHVYPNGNSDLFEESSLNDSDDKGTGFGIEKGKTSGEFLTSATNSESIIPVHYARGLYAPNVLGMIALPFPRWKRCMDIACAASGLMLSAPLLLIAAVAIKLSSKGPVFFRQWRTGQNNHPFSIVKLRTMVVDAEELKDKLRRMNERDGPAFKIKDDPRVTRVGKFLRATGLDELPQLWNVLVGEMSVVGPRPLPVDEDALCQQWHRRRLDTKPGITCLWQISKSRQISFDDWMRMDIQYASRQSLRNDVSLMFRTVAAVVLGRVGH